MEEATLCQLPGNLKVEDDMSCLAKAFKGWLRQN